MGVSIDPGKSIPIEKGHFTQMLIEENALEESGFEAWLFCHGMLFDSKIKWWGDRGRRNHPHEGIDFCLYQSSSGKIHRLNADTRIPVMHDGVVKAVCKDYLGKTIVLEHTIPDSRIERVVSFYGHTKPYRKIMANAHLKEGDILATLSETGSSKSNIIPHLHFSIGIPSSSFSYDEYIWDAIREPQKIVLLGPLPLLDRPYRTLDAGDPACGAL